MADDNNLDSMELQQLQEQQGRHVSSASCAEDHITNVSENIEGLKGDIIQDETTEPRYESSPIATE